MLDKSKPYGLVSGLVDGFPGARYCQGGAYYTPSGNRLGGGQGPSLAELSSLHWKQLKKRVEEAGGVYDGRDTAIAFLTKG